MTVIRPLDNQVLISADEREEKSKGGIIMPETAKAGPTCSGVVKAVGPGLLLDSGERAPMQLRPGDHVYYGKYNGADIEIDREPYKLVIESDILARDARKGEKA